MRGLEISARNEAAHRGSMAHRFAAWLMQVGAARRQRAAERAAEDQLAAFDDRMLDDIGLKRDEVSKAIRDGRPDAERAIPYWSR